MSVLGLKIEPSKYTPQRSVIGGVEASVSGNIVLRVGRENREGGWRKTEHVVLTPTEAEDLINQLDELLG